MEAGGVWLPGDALPSHTNCRQKAEPTCGKCMRFRPHPIRVRQKTDGDYPLSRDRQQRLLDAVERLLDQQMARQRHTERSKREAEEVLPRREQGSLRSSSRPTMATR